eukprot:139373-Prymnesium_polylepis.2
MDSKVQRTNEEMMDWTGSQWRVAKAPGARQPPHATWAVLIRVYVADERASCPASCVSII